MMAVANAYARSKDNQTRNLIVGISVIFACIYGIQKLLLSFSSDSFMSSRLQVANALTVSTWNIAAINNNPFEYWITNDDPNYNDLMKKVSKFITEPGDKDVPVSQIFTSSMFDNLMENIKMHTSWTGLEETKLQWDDDFSKRKIISEFLKDPLLGKKRLISMTDRVTNTINVAGQEVPLTRPTVINCYDGKTVDGSVVTLDSVETWWPTWLEFMFKREISVADRNDKTKVKKQAIFDMLQPIKKSKYPSLTEEEEKISLPLQTLCGAIFDAILVHMMNQISPVAGPNASKGGWEGIRTNMCDRLNRHKTTRILEILETTYRTQDVIFLQEVAGSFKAKATAQRLGSEYFDVMSPVDMDTSRDQNSYILLQKERFTEITEVTDKVLETLAIDAPKAPVAKGDVYAITALDSKTGHKMLFASFHGDTNGLATIPVVTAVTKFAQQKLPSDYRLLFGLDANTYGEPEEDQQDVVSFGEFFSNLPRKVNSCYGQKPSRINFTTFNARTHLQPQLNKAVAFEEIDVSKKRDKNPKDFILFYEQDYSVLDVRKDNTGEGHYVEGMVFPTLDFPSDHGITSTVLHALHTTTTGGVTAGKKSLREK